MKKIINTIKLIPSNPIHSGNRETFWLISEGYNLIREDSNKIALHVDYVDFDHPENNIFKVVSQYTVSDKKTRRPDMLLFINGIPLGIFEYKSAIKEDTTICDAWEQIHIRYKRDIPKLMKYTMMSVISDGANSRLGTVFTPYRFYYAWNKANEHDTVKNGVSSLFTLIKGAFEKKRVLSILRDFIFYPDDSKSDTAIICRYPQYFAANKMLQNIKVHMKPEGDGKGGTYFGATGCGKTYTMLFLSRLMTLRDNQGFQNPTIIILVDREDLNTQTSELFVTAKKYLHEEDVRSIESRDDLEKTLKNKSSGGVYITTIQKFCESTGLLSERNNIICISDEAHRTQTSTGSKLKKTEEGVFTTYGFGYYLRSSFPNATYCGFTGTPIDEINITLGVFRNHLSLVDDLMLDFDATKFFGGTPLERLNCLGLAAEYVQISKENQVRFMGLTRRLKSAYHICFPSGELTEEETAKAQFYLAIRSIIYKQTIGDAPDAETMNMVVEEMVKEAITCTGIENIVNTEKNMDLFSEDFLKELDTVNLPITKFNALLKLLKKQ